MMAMNRKQVYGARSLAMFNSTHEPFQVHTSREHNLDQEHKNAFIYYKEQFNRIMIDLALVQDSTFHDPTY